MYSFSRPKTKKAPLEKRSSSTDGRHSSFERNSSSSDRRSSSLNRRSSFSEKRSLSSDRRSAPLERHSSIRQTYSDERSRVVSFEKRPSHYGERSRTASPLRRSSSSERRPSSLSRRSFSRRRSSDGQLSFEKKIPIRSVTSGVEFKGDKDKYVKIVPLGGMEEVGRNMLFVEYKNEIVIVDMGFQFPEEETPGIDYIIPNVSYLEGKKENIVGAVITHGHLDHVGAVPYIIEKLGNPMIYTSQLSKAMLEKRQEEFVNAPKLNIKTVVDGETVEVGNHLKLEFFNLPHTIPDTIGVIIKTPIGNIVYFVDFRLDRDSKGEPIGLDAIKCIGDMGVHTFLVDSTNAEKTEESIPEQVVEENIKLLFQQAKGRIILTTFASTLDRLDKIIEIADQFGRSVVLNGRSMKDNIKIAQDLGYMKIRKGLIVTSEEAAHMRDEKVLILTTGNQGEPRSGIVKIVNGEHRNFQIKEGDTIIFSSSIVPGNEKSVQTLKDNLARQGAIVHQSDVLDLHSSGHATSVDLKIVMKLIRPQFLMPAHGYYFMRAANGKNGVESGIPKENIRLLDNGQVGLLGKGEFIKTNEFVPAHYVMVDGLGVGDVGEVVLRDRLMLAQEGMLVIIATLDRKSGQIIKNPDIISRGFIYLRENQKLLDDIRYKLHNIIKRLPHNQAPELDYVKAIIRDQIGQFLYIKTNRRPMILPVIIEV